METAADGMNPPRCAPQHGNRTMDDSPSSQHGLPAQHKHYVMAGHDGTLVPPIASVVSLATLPNCVESSQETSYSTFLQLDGNKE